MDVLQKIKSTIIQELRSAQLNTDPLLKKLIAIFLLVFVSQLIILNVFFPIEELEQDGILPPIKMSFPSKPSTMQDRFEYSFKDLRAQMDKELLRKIWAEMNHPLGKGDLSGDIDHLFEHSDNKILPRIHELLNYKRGGFFVEYGASDGANHSYTLYFERQKDFTGLLIEPDPNAFKRLMELRRNVWAINSGVSIHPIEKQCTFIRWDHGGRIMKDFAQDALKGTFDLFNITCFPLTSMLLAISQPSIDLLILNIEGASLNILKTITWTQFDIQLIVVIEGPHHQDKEDSLEKYMIYQGFDNRGIIEGPWTTNRIRNTLRKLKAKQKNNSVESSLCLIFVLMMVFNLGAIFFLWPAPDDPAVLYAESILAIPMPMKIQQLKPIRSIQDRFKYAVKELKSQVGVETIREIRKNWLKLPPTVGTPINETFLSKFGRSTSLKAQRFQDRILEVLPTERNGFYVEYGAFNGIADSYTFYLGFFKNWSGLLIEADPKYFQKLTEVGRNAWTINCCLSIHPRVEKNKMLRYKYADRLSIMAEFADMSGMEDKPTDEFEAQCFPLISILLAANVTTVDYLSLQAEGAALHILKTHLWHLVHIKVISIIESDSHADKAASFNAVLPKFGYISRGILPMYNSKAFIFVHEKYI
ncbi:unnamed protein product [Allacma fusca]|uniref:Methyltransferase FkbM domain-containing protein n=1 Tax=Allacma fusca TaxID=39272 RepID=A0A8J2JL54_9HEXA|nr:unnamed protein product [Allacma fusca]